MRSKYSCGFINYKAQYLSNEGFLLNLFLMVFGVFLMFFGGVKFKTFMFIIAGILTFLLIVVTLMSVFNIRLSGSIMAFFSSIGIIGVLILKYIRDLYKHVVNVIIGYVGISFGFNLTESIDPELIIF